MLITSPLDNEPSVCDVRFKRVRKTSPHRRWYAKQRFYPAAQSRVEDNIHKAVFNFFRPCIPLFLIPDTEHS